MIISGAVLGLSRLSLSLRHKQAGISYGRAFAPAHTWEMRNKLLPSGFRAERPSHLGSGVSRQMEDLPFSL